MLPLWLGALCVVVAGGLIARKWHLPDAVIWPALGFALGFFRAADRLRLDPHIALFLLLPPLVYAASVQLPWPEFRKNLRPIVVLAFGLVLANAALVAVVGAKFAGLPWLLAIALGAVLSPTDPAAASAVASGAGLPGRLVAILEGEGLVNDAVALTMLRLAVTAAVTGSFSPASGAIRFLAIVIGEPLYGYLLAVAIMAIRARIRDPRLEITVSLLTPFAAYLVPEHFGGSGILATVAAGMYIGERRSDVVPAGTRLHAASVWETVVFLLNGLLFLMAGVQLRRIVGAAPATLPLVGWGIAVVAVLVAARAGWCALMWILFRGRSMLAEEDGRPMPARHMAVIAWSGMRGPISLAAALSIPVLGPRIAPQTSEMVLFITAVIIAVTLVAQGVALPYVIRFLGVSKDAAADAIEDQRQLNFGTGEAAKAALEELSRLGHNIEPHTAERVRAFYQDRLDQTNNNDESRRLFLRLIEAERKRIHALRREGRINDRVVAELDRILDLRQSTLSSSDITA